MSKLAIRYVGAVLDSSGYANAARHYVGALIKHPDIDLTVTPLSFETLKTTHGALGNEISAYLNRPINCKIQITHATPENYARCRQPNTYNIGYTAWETERLPDEWVPLCNGMDELWVPSQWNVEVFRNSGVTRPIFCVPHVVPKSNELSAQPLGVVTMDSRLNSDTYIFYSIFQWTERKNPEALLKAYLTEFGHKDNVCLVLKTYRINTSPQEKTIIKNEIAVIKRKLNLENFPPMILLGDLLPDEMLFGLHQEASCFVLPHRGEGFGIPIAEAMAFAKPVIASGYSGCMEFMTPTNSFIVDCQRTPVFGMIFGNYNGKMTWGSPDVMQLRRHMRYCYEHSLEASETGLRAQRDMQTKYSSEAIGAIMANRLNEIAKEIA